MAKKEISLSVDIEELEKQLTEKRDEEPSAKPFTVRSTVFSLGKDPRVGTKQQISSPSFYLIEILKDRMDNPYLFLHWRVPRSEIDAGRIVGFNVYRRRMREEDALRKPLSFNRNAFDKLARGNKKTGKFSADRKAIYNIKRGSIPIEVLNPNLAQIKKAEESRLFGKDIPLDSPTYSQGDFDRFLSRRKFEKIAYVDYTEFIKQEKNKFLYVVDRNFAELSYKDKKVGLEETFEYYIESVSKELDDPPRSEIISVTIEDTQFVNAPSRVIAKQINENEIQLSIGIDPKEKAEKVLVYRRSEDEISFDKIIETNNVADTINIIDGDVRYNKSYVYRVFLKNIHGNLSEPKEISVFSSVQKVTPQSRSNNLKIPIISAVQDQNSDFVRITISPNDPNIAYYEIKRRDLSIYEKKFAVPSQTETNYGGSGWAVDKFFVESSRENLSSDTNTSPLKTKTTFKEIIFVDDLVYKGHIYQYRTRGYDLFGNPSSYAFATVRATGKKSLRTPINIRSEVLRGFPFRVKISWDDDNVIAFDDPQKLFDGESELEKKPNNVLYKVQRRKLGEVFYETFPTTANNFIIDEVSAIDAVNFEGKKINDTYARQDNVSSRDEKLKLKDDIRRAFKLPNFLKENDIYFYRIIALSKGGEESNASEEFQISTLPDLSDPIDFAAEANNTKVRPVTVKLSWITEDTKSRPDRWVIEKKFDTDNDSFSVIGTSYLVEEFFDRNVELGNTYIYRIKAFDVIGRESAYFETRLTL
jgi:hypothetical protein